MKIVVTGSAGHLGEALMRTLRQSAHQPFGIDLAPSPFTDAVGSITDAAFVARCLEDAEAVLHTATLHKPHIATHTQQDFIDTNLGGTLALLEASRAAGVRAFVFTSTTSTFGAALNPPPQAPAVWVTESLAPRPRNIYGVTKVAAEDLCELHHRRDGLPCIVLRTSRFFPEDDDRADVRAAFGSLNTKINEFLYRRVDIEDVVAAHLLAIERAPAIGFGRYIISATTPFVDSDLDALRRDARAVVARLFPDQPAEYERRQWRMFETLDRVYVNERARRELGWRPRHDFRSVLERLQQRQDPGSTLAREIGIKGYHARRFDAGPYPV